MNENVKTKKGKGFAVAAAVFFLATLGFSLLAVWLGNSMRNYHPAPNEVQEGDMVSALAVMFLIGAAIVSLIIAAVNLLIFVVKYYRGKN